MTRTFRCWFADDRDPDDETDDCKFDVVTVWDREVGRNVAQDAADYDHRHRSGYERNGWPLVVCIQQLDDDGHTCGPVECYEVDREIVINFTAIRKPSPESAP